MNRFLVYVDRNEDGSSPMGIQERFRFDDFVKGMGVFPLVFQRSLCYFIPNLVFISMTQNNRANGDHSWKVSATPRHFLILSTIASRLINWTEVMYCRSFSSVVLCLD